MQREEKRRKGVSKNIRKRFSEDWGGIGKKTVQGKEKLGTRLRKRKDWEKNEKEWKKTTARKENKKNNIKKRQN